MYVLIAPEHSHCICGGKNDEGGHEHENMRWMPWTATDSHPTGAGNYYLVGDVVLSSENPARRSPTDSDETDPARTIISQSA